MAILSYETDDLLRRRAASGTAYLEFLRAPTMSCGVYHLPAGGTDPQGPHSEDEVYVVVRGRATIRVGRQDRAVGPGSIVFVAARTPHRFHSIVEDLDVLVIFAPAEGARAAGARRRGPRKRRSPRRAHPR